MQKCSSGAEKRRRSVAGRLIEPLLRPIRDGTV
jgi:hypothetical protein